MFRGATITVALPPPPVRQRRRPRYRASSAGLRGLPPALPSARGRAPEVPPRAAGSPSRGPGRPQFP
jgi:hypothetical protein